MLIITRQQGREDLRNNILVKPLALLLPKTHNGNRIKDTEKEVLTKGQKPQRIGSLGHSHCLISAGIYLYLKSGEIEISSVTSFSSLPLNNEDLNGKEEIEASCYICSFQDVLCELKRKSIGR